jgi:hypothetical protein
MFILETKSSLQKSLLSTSCLKAAQLLFYEGQREEIPEFKENEAFIEEEFYTGIDSSLNKDVDAISLYKIGK